MEIARTENIETEGLIKHYDAQNRLVKIEFTRSGNSCTIQYPSVPAIYNLARIVKWNNGCSYFTYKKGDTTQFTEVKPTESPWDDLKFEKATI